MENKNVLKAVEKVSEVKTEISPTVKTGDNIYEIELKGCKAEPFISYLKSLGINRLLSQQLYEKEKAKNPNLPEIKSYWKDRKFHLKSPFSKERIIKFFLEEYEPTPIVSPWNGGSGFYEGDNTEGIDSILSSSHERFEVYRNVIQQIQKWSHFFFKNLSIKDLLIITGKYESDKKIPAYRVEIENCIEKLKLKLPPEVSSVLTSYSTEILRDKSGSNKAFSGTIYTNIVKTLEKLRTALKLKSRSENKEKLIQLCRNQLPETVVEWIDASCVIASGGEMFYPPILGSGGNDGRLDFSNNFMKCLKQLLLDKKKSDESLGMLENSLFDSLSDSFDKFATGFFDPGRAGGYNQGTGIEFKNIPVNLWEIVLSMEGAIVWGSVVTNKYGNKRDKLLSSPFTVRPRGVGYASSSKNDEGSARAEIWTPLWNKPVNFNELKAFIGKGRVDISSKGSRKAVKAGNTIEFAEAVASLGTDTGVDDFVRYSILERRGKSYIALPAGVIKVNVRKEADLARELQTHLNYIDRFLKNKFVNIPQSFQSARLQIDDHLFDLLVKGGAVRSKTLIASIGKLEKLLSNIKNDKNITTPVGVLSPQWITQSFDGTLEVKISAAVASISYTEKVAPIRANLVPVYKPFKDWAGQDTWKGNSIFSRLLNVLQRRMMDAARLGCTKNPLWSYIKVSIDDVMQFIEGNFDYQLIENLIFGFSIIRWNHPDSKEQIKQINQLISHKRTRFIRRDYALLKLLFSTDIFDTQGNPLKQEPAILPMLQAGRVKDAVHIAQRRLFTAGLNPIKSNFPDVPGNEGIRLASSLIIPLREKDIFKIKKLILKD